MKKKYPIAALFLAAAALFAGEATAAQKPVAPQSIRSGNYPVEYADRRGNQRGRYGGKYGRTVHIRAHRAPRRVWMPGHYEWVTRQVWVPGWTEKVWIEPQYEWRCDYRGGRYQVLIRPGFWEDVHHRGYYEPRRERVWRPGYWQTRHYPEPR